VSNQKLQINDSTLLGVLLAQMRMKLLVPNPEVEGETMEVDAIPWRETEDGISCLIPLPVFMHFATTAYQIQRAVVEVEGVPPPHNQAIQVWLKKPDTSRIVRPGGATIPSNLKRLMNGNG
jgi:hypothetical protein